MAYFANGTEGEILDEQCSDCRIPDDAPCPVLWVQTHYNYKQLDKGKETLTSELMNCLVDENGKCLMKVEIDKVWGDEYFSGPEHDTAKKILDSM